MLTRFDHAVIAVRDLAAGVTMFERLGFTVTPGGSHMHVGTSNAVVRFGLDYIELISVEDREAAIRTARGAELARYLEVRSIGWVGFALAATGLRAQRERFAAAGLAAPESFEMERARPDGSIFRWRLLVPEGVAWRRPWPFLIEWSTPDSERMNLEPAQEHANGASRITGVSVVVGSPAAATLIYEDALGLPLRAVGPGDRGSSARAACLGEFDIVLNYPTGSGMVDDGLAQDREGLFEVEVQVPNLDLTADLLTRNHVSFAEERDRLVVGSETFLPTRLAFRTADPRARQ